MKLLLSCCMYNEIENVKIQLEDALDTDFDTILILDDGSTDGTWDVLQEYSYKNKHVRVFRSDKNSLRGKGINRWLMLAQECLKYEPDWVCIRAADMLYSENLKNNIRDRIIQLDKEGSVRISFPVAHLWRSKYWHRVDKDWAMGFYTDSPEGLNMGYMNLAWKNGTDFYFSEKEKLAIGHNGAHIPWIKGENKEKASKINFGLDEKTRFVILHHAFTSQEKFISKFKDMMERSSKSRVVWSGVNVSDPNSFSMPPVSQWYLFNSYKIFYEFGLKLNKISRVWVNHDIPDEKTPVPESMYEIIKEYNPERAEEYRKIFEKHYK